MPEVKKVIVPEGMVIEALSETSGCELMDVDSSGEEDEIEERKE